MTQRSSRSILNFPHPFKLSGYTDELPAGDYELQIEEELLEGLSFYAYRRTGMYLTVHGRGQSAGLTESRSVSEADLKAAIPARGEPRF